MGGMGNQMFQYAFGVLLGPDTIYDISWFNEIKGNNNITQREYELDFWNVNPVLINKSRKRILGIFKRKINYETQTNVYNQKLLNAKRGIFEGYFQVAEYYDSIREQLLKDFTPKNKPNSKNKKALNLICKTNSISIHIRRGDYVKLQHINGLCGLDYYAKAIEFMAKNTISPHFFIFSDDIQWVRDNLKTDFPCHYIDFNHGRDSAWDMWLMANCKHNINANSSFSWWGAWLNKNPDKIVITPCKWFANNKQTDIIHKNWKRI